ncbi:sensor histidine kinase [Cellulomonas shaoxiangyii]|uniref:histidine kinase n=1 Tax=Cellulomonas shaoxiangyii TaxID=2566013 RepID=A0A4P7SNT3_9CELL|nr:histidine kinase [Cellulomonas shaoxiangyii]QCB94614.1 two-component sensor histidine kinase [Cellulomonas shaoxiangyii]TGY84143.1 two-component sensor histidine kinase [Cellulomonas shaoxiangyii]
MPPPAPVPPRLGPWSRTWRYLVAGGTGLVVWSVVVLDASTNAPEPGSLGIGLLVTADLLIGLGSLALLPLRRQVPVVVAVLLVAATSVSTFAVGPAALALVSLATRRRWRELLPVGGVWLLGSVANEMLNATVVRDERVGVMLLPALGLSALVWGLLVAIGFYVGTRRELVRSLEERALVAEAAQESRAEQARAAERTRIAREMHDVLAHRISLVALQAGGLAFRDDLSRDEVRAAAETVRDGAHRALEELREVLGVLRADAPAATEEEPPQPTLDELPALLADVDEAGAPVTLDVSALPGATRTSLSGVPASVSRTAFRLLQEALTNAQKHAPGAPVAVRLAGEPGGRLELTVVNDAAPVGVHAGSRVPGAGLGLVGARERATLAGGGLEHGPDAAGRFVVRAWLPWSA